MSRFNFTSALGDNLSPFAPKKEYEVATAIGIGLGAASLLGSAYSAYQNMKNQADTNKTNLQIHREQTAQQERQFQQSIAENRALIDQAYERNLPKEQVKALKEAGINPAFAMDSSAFGTTASQAGSAPSVPSMPSAPNLVAPQMGDLGQGVSNAASMYLATQKQESDISYLKQKEVNETLETIGKLQNYHFQNKQLEASANEMLQNVLYNQETWELKKRNLDLINQAQQADIDYKKSLQSYQDLLNKFEPDKQKKILREFDARYDEIRSSIRRNDADSARALAAMALDEARKKGVDMENELADQIIEARINTAYDEEETAYWNSRNARKEAGSQKYGVGPYSVEQRYADEAANDPDHMRVYHDRKGRKFFFDSKSNKRIYVDK